MFFKSIRWRLQIWYGLILVLVLVGFGVTAYQLERGRQLRRVDEELQRRLNTLAGALRQGPPRNRFPGGERPPGAPEPDDAPGPPRGRPFDGPPDDQPQGPREGPREFHLPPQHAALFDEGDPNGFYYFIQTGFGKELARSTNVPPDVISLFKAVDYPTASYFSNQPSRFSEPQMQPPQMRGNFREVILRTPPGETILVGRSIAPELADLHRTALKLGGVGGIILALGLAGGWWLASRTIRPIETISATASKISAGDLSQRINIHDTDSELGQLAAVLNSTFARLDAAFAQQSRFTADAAHELRTPIAVMLTQTQSALARNREAADYRETIEACQRATQRMRRLIESLLELARLDAGQENMKRMKFDLSNTARESVETIMPLAAERGIRIECNFEPTETNGDPERIAQVITNLLTNAIHYNRDNGEIHLRTLTQDGFATLTVTDSGNGISRDDLPHIFDRFYRAEKSRTAGRTGLGLAISKAIIEAHGGTIEAASELDQGTTFTVRLRAVYFFRL